MAFRTPPEVLLRTVIRSKGRVGPVLSKPVLEGRARQTGTRFYQAAVCTQLNQPLLIQSLALPDAVPPGQILVATHAAGVNFADMLTVQGKYQQKAELPFVPGSELSGVVEKVGEGVKDIKPGDRVVALAQRAFGEYCLVDSNAAFALPDSVSLVEAASLLISYSTAYLALSRTAQLKQGETLLVTAAAGATGLAAIDLALNVFKAQVVGVCGGAAKCQFLQSRGVTGVVDYTSQDVPQRVKELTQGKMAHVAMDQVGGDLFNACLKSLAFEGRLLTVGYASGNIPSLGVNKLLLKSCSVRGVWWGNYRVQNPQAFADSIRSVLSLFAQGKLRPHVGKVFPLSQVNEAFDFISSRQSVGKVVIQMKD